MLLSLFVLWAKLILFLFFLTLLLALVSLSFMMILEGYFNSFLFLSFL